MFIIYLSTQVEVKLLAGGQPSPGASRSKSPIVGGSGGVPSVKLVILYLYLFI